MISEDAFIAVDKAVTVGASTAVELLPDGGNSNREIFVITNGTTTGQIVRLGIGKEADGNSGIVLVPGGVYIEVIDSVFRPTNKRITAIVDAGTTQVYVHMRVVPPR